MLWGKSQQFSQISQIKILNFLEHRVEEDPGSGRDAGYLRE
jgi:hypothetical protein